MKTTKIKTWLPVFPGFYSTIYEPDETNEIEHIQDMREICHLPELDSDLIEFDYETYRNEISKNACDVFLSDMTDFISDIEFENTASPKYYNFSNDSINCTIELTEANINSIKKFIDTNKVKFEKYLKDKYTSYDGFISSHSNDIEDWLNDLHNILNDSHKLGSILEFIWYYDTPEKQEFDTDDSEMYFFERVMRNVSLTVSNYCEVTSMNYCYSCSAFIQPKDMNGSICFECFELERKNADVIVCAECNEQITNNWDVRQFQHKIKHGLIDQLNVRCSDCL